ncbi:hypothetical protein MRX96_034732 [Rhipicephalus microplus]
MPRELADVQVVSRMPVPSSHLYSSRSSHLYSSTSSLRSTSLDRRSATLRDSSSSSSSGTSYISRLPPRPSFEHRSKVVSDLPRLSSRVVLDVSSGSRRSLTRQRSGDAISDAGSPVLTRYRDLGTDSPSSRASSPARRLLDENCNRASTPTRRLDWNHNVYNGSGGSHSLPPDSAGRDSGASISPASSRHWRNLGSSTSSVDSGGSSSSDCSPGLRRVRRLSLTSEHRAGAFKGRDHRPISIVERPSHRSPARAQSTGLARVAAAGPRCESPLGCARQRRPTSLHGAGGEDAALPGWFASSSTESERGGVLEKGVARRVSRIPRCELRVYAVPSSET